ncbi:MAG: ribosomal L7Ae/L30e/S12e/Gadd45 family protein [Clostridia bacterium]|nr:ribosomal L7Ae/L30e/S12e/Gadd45 family protein [Clostridia bacterium]
MRRTLGLIGLAARAGRVTTGQEGVESAVKKKKAILALVDANASERTKKDIRDACRYAQADMLELPADALGGAIGKSGRMCAAVTDGSLAKRILELAAQEAESNGSTTIGGA